MVENVERWLNQGLSPRDATRKAMEEVTGPVVAVALVLCAVFVPCAFISGITGRFFLQIAVTISVSTVFSAINSLTLSPALAAILLRPHDGSHDPLTKTLNALLGWFFRLFNRAFDASTEAYGWTVGKMLSLSVIVLVAYGGLLMLTYWVFQVAPTGFVPDQDQGRVIANVQLPDSSALQRTQEVVDKISKIALKDPGVAHVITISGMSFVLSATSSNFASMFIVLKPFDERKSPEMRDTAVMARLRKAWALHIKDAQVMVFGAPPIPGLSVAGGFKLLVEDRGGLGLTSLQKQTNALVKKLQQQPGLMGVSTQFRSNAPQLFMDIDREKVESLGMSVNDVNQTLSMYMGSLYVNSFNAFGRHWQVTIQADGDYRSQLDGLNLLTVRNRGRTDGSAEHVVPYSRNRRSGVCDAIQPFDGGTCHGQFTSWRQHGRSDCRHGSAGESDVADFDEDRMDRVDVHADSGRKHRDLCVSAGHSVRVPGAGSSLRKLVIAAGSNPCRAAVSAMLGLWRINHGFIG